MTKAKDDEARQAEFLCGKLQESGKALEKRKAELQSKDAAFEEEKEHLEVPLCAVVDSLAGKLLLESFEYYQSARVLCLIPLLF